MYFAIDDLRGEALEFTQREKKEDFEAAHPECSLVTDIEVVGTLRKSGVDVYLSGEIRTELFVTCTRCLEPFKFPVKCMVTARYVPQSEPDKEHAEVELDASDIEIEYYDDGRVDITQSVCDQILLEVPQICLCEKDCKGLCPDCGENLNLGACGCGNESSIDPRLDILKTLKDKLK
ncbi:MAG: DUF177 domain-containing protein [Nitrospinae bacterium]|jgi:uncharacterized protein|nr:DUF177 domain-containing protein [Nitrospinota bacterium]